MTCRFGRVGLKAGVLILALSSAAAYASAQNTSDDQNPFRGGRGRGPGGPGGPAGPAMGFLGSVAMMVSQLGLTASQKDQLKSIAQSHSEEWKALLTREQQARQAQQAAVDAAQFDEVTIRQRSADLAAIEADIAVARARARGELLQVLTTDQQSKLQEMQANGFRGRGPGRRGPA
jgi:periplasmic protein CpxP/Spy